jgi:PAS domain S-box-containing protein
VFGGALKAAGATYGHNRHLLLVAGAARAAVALLGAAGTVTVVYFFAARLGLALLSAPSDVAVFWPASGVAAGILIISRRRAWPALVTGVVVGTVAANLMSDRSLLTSLLKGVCNAGEAVLVAWLLEQWFDRPFRVGDLRRLAGFLVAACLATAASATGGAATMTLLHTAAPYWDVWRAWFLSNNVGIVVVAPLMIGIAQVWREPPSQREWIEGVGALGLATLASVYTTRHTTASWLSFSPGAIVLPVLLWLTARCQPAFGIAGAFIASTAVILATTFGVGRFGDAAVPLIERVKGAQAATMTVTLFTLVLIALFAQRKETEEELRESEGQLAKKSTALARLHDIGTRLWYTRDLRRALDDILKGAIELLGADMGVIRILDPTRGTLKIEAHRGLADEFLGSFREVPAAGDSPCGWALQSGERMVIADVEAGRSSSLLALAHSAGFRAVQSSPIMSREGVLLGTLATHFRAVHKPSEQDFRLLDLYVRQAADIIERHRADDALRESEERLRLAQLRTGVGIWDWNLLTGKVTWTPELEALFGLEPGTVKRYADFRDRVHPQDLAAVEARREAALQRRETYTVEYRIIRPDGQVRWILAVGGALYDELTGEPIRILGNNADITDRKRAEERQQVLVAELDHRVKNVLATVSAVVSHTREGSRSVTNFAAALEGRIRSMANTHQLLSSRRWQGIPLTKLVRGELAPYATRDNIQFSGPEIILRPEAGQAMANVLHELATNAAKYGALSIGTGRVSIRWHRRANGQPRSPLVLEWQEIDGPTVVAPSRSGYGTRTVRDLIPYEFGGSVDLLLDPEGVRCRLELPADWLAHDATEVSGPSAIPSAS